MTLFFYWCCFAFIRVKEYVLIGNCFPSPRWFPTSSCARAARREAGTPARSEQGPWNVHFIQLWIINTLDIRIDCKISVHSVTNSVAYFSLHKTLLPTILLLPWPCPVTFRCIGLTSHCHVICHIYISTVYIYISTVYIYISRATPAVPWWSTLKRTTAGSWRALSAGASGAPSPTCPASAPGSEEKYFLMMFKIFFNECTA